MGWLPCPAPPHPGTQRTRLTRLGLFAGLVEVHHGAAEFVASGDPPRLLQRRFTSWQRSALEWQQSGLAAAAASLAAFSAAFPAFFLAAESAARFLMFARRFCSSGGMPAFDSSTECLRSTTSPRT